MEGGAAASSASTDMVTILVDADLVLVDRSVNVRPDSAWVGGGVTSGAGVDDTSEANADAEAEADALADTEAEPLRLAETEADAEADPDAETDAETEADADAEADPLAEGSAEADPLSVTGVGAAPMGPKMGESSSKMPWGARFLMMRFRDAWPPRRSSGVWASTAVATRRRVRKVKSVVVLCDKASIVIVFLFWCGERIG